MGQVKCLCSWQGSSVLMDSKLLQARARQIPDILVIKMNLIFLKDCIVGFYLKKKKITARMDTIFLLWYFAIVLCIFVLF